MKRILIYSISLLTALGLSHTISAQEAYQNPVLRIDYPDPTVWQGNDGMWYMFATGGIEDRTMYRSENLHEWKDTGMRPYDHETALQVIDAFEGNGAFWAPFIYKVNEQQWNLYLTKPSGGIAFLTSNNPTQGFRFVKMTTAPFYDYIDPTIVREADGTTWMFAGSCAGMHRRQMTPDALDFAEGSTWEHMAGLSCDDKDNSQRSKTLEGENLYYRNGYWYLICSSGEYWSHTYSIKVGRSRTLQGDFVDKQGRPMKKGYASTILSSKEGDALYGGGHNSEIVTDKEGRTWTLYHSHWTGLDDQGARYVCLGEIGWDDEGWPYFK